MTNSFYPIIAGRVSDSLNRTRSLSQLQVDQIAMGKLQNQLSTGQRITLPSEDPVAAVRILALQRQQENQKQAIVNLDSANGSLAVTENALSSLNDSLQDVKGLALDAASNVISDGERQAIFDQIADQLNRALSVSNQSYMDRYIFAGGAVRQQPYSNSGDGINYTANTLSLDTVGLAGTMVTNNVSGGDAFGGLSDGVVGLTNLSPAVTAETKLSQLNDGTGVGKGAIQFSDGNEVMQIDLANAYRISDVIDRINTVKLSGRSINASMTASGLQIDFADAAGGVLRVSNVGVGTVATGLGIETTVPAPTLPIVGNDLRNTLSPATKLSDLFNGAGLPNTDGIKITQGQDSYDVSFDGAQTVQDVLVKINNSGAKVNASIAPDGKRIQIQSTLSGVDFSISETTGNTASALGLKTFRGDVKLSELNYGQGIFAGDGNDLQFTRTDGSALSLDLSSAVTVSDVVDLINNHVDNQDPALKITASINPTGNGLILSAPEPVAPALGEPIRIKNAGGSQAAEGLVLIPKGQTESVATLSTGVYTITGGDPNPQEVKGVFNSLVRLRDAVQSGDISTITRISTELDKDIARLSLVRGAVGIEQQRIDKLKTTNEDQILSAKDSQSQLFDTDYASAIAELTSRQVAYQASLQLMSNVMNGANLFSFL
jgi:flagellar hook-associated protein 3 FlgL